MPARVCCLDLDTFFVSVERLLDPSLVGRPVVVGASPGSRGVVTSCSYEVRGLGVRSGMPMAEAQRLAPDAVFVPTRHGVYGPYAARVKAVLERFCPVVRTASIDEFFLDFSGCERLYARPGDIDATATIERVVREMRVAIQDDVGLPASAGLAPTRPLAKIASGRAKPAGVLLVREGAERAFVDPLPVRRWPGIGPVAEQRLVAAGLTTLGQLLEVHDGPHAAVAAGVRAGLCAGDVPTRDRPAFQEHDEDGGIDGSLSNERTFHADVGQVQVVLDALRSLVERVAWRARRRGAPARTITLKLRYADFTTLTRSQTGPPTHAEADILAVTRGLLRDNWARRNRIRLLGVGLSHFVAPEKQVPLPFPTGRPTIGQALDAVRDRFGYDAIRLGTATGGAPRPRHRSA